MSLDKDQDRIVEDLRAGGRRGELAVSTLHKNYYVGMVSFLTNKRNCSFHIAEECVQEAFVKLIRKIDTFDGRSSLKTWLYTILENTWRDVLKRADVKNHLKSGDCTDIMLEIPDNEADTPHRIAERISQIECVRKGYAQFRHEYPDRAKWLSLIANEDKTPAELALQAGKSAGAMRQYLLECRIKLRPYIEHCGNLWPDI